MATDIEKMPAKAAADLETGSGSAGHGDIAEESGGLKKELRNRHMQMIAIGENRSLLL
jgi:amino acid permease